MSWMCLSHASVDLGYMWVYVPHVAPDSAIGQAGYKCNVEETHETWKKRGRSVILRHGEKTCLGHEEITPTRKGPGGLAKAYKAWKEHATDMKNPGFSLIFHVLDVFVSCFCRSWVYVGICASRGTRQCHRPGRLQAQFGGSP